MLKKLGSMPVKDSRDWYTHTHQRVANEVGWNTGTALPLDDSWKESLPQRGVGWGGGGSLIFFSFLGCTCRPPQRPVSYLIPDSGTNEDDNKGSPAQLLKRLNILP